MKKGKPFSKAKYDTLNDSGKYCKGKLKREKNGEFIMHKQRK